MGVLVPTVIFICVFSILTIWAWKVLNWVWLRPKKMERCLRQQGISGNSYRILFGDSKEIAAATRAAESKPINLISDDVAPRALPFVHQTVQKYGKNSFMWDIGPLPRVNIMNPEYLREIYTKYGVFQKPDISPFLKAVVTGLAMHNGDKWAKHRKIISSAFHLEKLKNMLPAFRLCCGEMISKWDKLVPEEGSIELDVCPYFENLTADVISRTAFGTSYEEGRRIFQLQEELVQLLAKTSHIINIPGWRFLPTKVNRKMKEINREIEILLKNMINKREKTIRANEATINNDLLSILVESNYKEIKESGNKNVGMSIKDVIEECKLFYFAGHETTSLLLVWTLVLLGGHPNWQARARDEVLQVFGTNHPDFDGLSRLKVVTMILYEVLRLYPPVANVDRTVEKKTVLGEFTLPAGAQVFVPIALIQHDTQLWGAEANEFKPERFAQGISKAANGQVSFLAFGWGPRHCIGQNFAMIEAKLALSLILQRFDFKLSPSYTHAPTKAITLRPQYGAQIVLTKRL